MGLLEKRRARKFFIFVQDFEENDPKSHEGLDLHKVTARELISYAYCSFFYSFFFFQLTRECYVWTLSLKHCRKFGLEDDTIDFIGHALALHIDDSYLDEPAMEFVKKMKVNKLYCAICFIVN